MPRAWTEVREKLDLVILRRKEEEHPGVRVRRQAVGGCGGIWIELDQYLRARDLRIGVEIARIDQLVADRFHRHRLRPIRNDVRKGIARQVEAFGGPHQLSHICGVSRRAGGLLVHPIDVNRDGHEDAQYDNNTDEFDHRKAGAGSRVWVFHGGHIIGWDGARVS